MRYSHLRNRPIPPVRRYHSAVMPVSETANSTIGQRFVVYQCRRRPGFSFSHYRLTSRRMNDDAPPREIDIATAEGNICINEDELPTVTDSELAKFRLTREHLNQLFAMGVELVRGKTVRDRVRPVAAETLDGHWEVRIVRYSPLNDPLMQRRRPLGPRSKN
jgi:hypothetical protein